MDLYRMFGNISSKGTDQVVKTAIVYYSSGGTNYQLAKWAAEGAQAAGAEVKVLKVPETAPEQAIASNVKWKAHMEATEDVEVVTAAHLEWADAIVFSTPTRFGNMSSQMQSFFDTLGGAWAEGKLANKVVSAMSSAQNVHGGQEATILSLYATMCHWGAIIAAPGYTDATTFEAGGNPYGTTVTVDQDGRMMEDHSQIRAAVHHQVKRTTYVAEALKQLV